MDSIRAIKYVPLVLFIGLLVAYSYVHQREFNSNTPVSRLDLLHSLIAHKTACIDAYHENTSNKAVFEGHFYSDKAPGVVVLAFPAFVLAAGILHLCDISLDSELGWLISSWICCALSIGVITAFGGVALFTWLCEWVRPQCAYVTTAALYLGATPYPYTTLLMSHGVVAGLLSIAIWAGSWGLKRTDADRGWRSAARDAGAGLCCGLALASEYSSSLVMIGILIGIVPSVRRCILVVLGMMPGLILVPLYHWMCFGNPFTFGYHHEANFTQMHEGFFGIKAPKAENAFMLMFSGRHGLFFWSPVLASGFVGCSHLVRRSPSLFWTMYIVIVLHVTAISGYFFPSGGGMVGPRFLTPLLPLFALPVAFGIARFPRAGYCAALVSVLLVASSTLVGVLVPAGERNPLTDFYLPELLRGKVSHNIGVALGLPAHISIILLFALFALTHRTIWRKLRTCEADFDESMRSANVRQG